MSKLMAMVKKLGADSSLQTALPVVLKKAPAERGAFDGVVVDQVDGKLKDHMATLKTALDNGEMVKAEKIEMQAQAQKALEDAKETHKEKQEALQSATSMLISRQLEAKNAKTALNSKLQELSKASAQHTENQKRFEKATELLSTFTFLLERDVVPEPVPEVVEEKSVPTTTEKATMIEEAPAAVQLPVAQELITA